MIEVSTFNPYQFPTLNTRLFSHGIDCPEAKPYTQFLADTDNITVQCVADTPGQVTLDVIAWDDVPASIIGAVPYINDSFCSWTIPAPALGRITLRINDGGSTYDSLPFYIFDKNKPCIDTSLLIKFSHSCPILDNGVPNSYVASSNFQYEFRVTAGLRWDRGVSDINQTRDNLGVSRIPFSDYEDVWLLEVDWAPHYLHKVITGSFRHDTVIIRKGLEIQDLTCQVYRNYQMTQPTTQGGVLLGTGSGQLTLKTSQNLSALCC